jgi:acetylornithine/succinyldiaminopimelate/putrescine aminotransferase
VADEHVASVWFRVTDLEVASGTVSRWMPPRVVSEAEIDAALAAFAKALAATR